MAVWSQVMCSELRESVRTDAEYQRPADRKLESQLMSGGARFLRSMITGFGSGKNLPQEDVRDAAPNLKGYLRTQNVRPLMVSEVGKTYVRSNPSCRVDYGDILAVRVGAGVGDFCVVGRHHAGHGFSDNVLRLKVRNVNPFYLCTYLSTETGRRFLAKNQKGTARGLISKENFYFIPVPELGLEAQQSYEDDFTEAESLVVNSEALYAQALELLDAELGLNIVKLQKSLDYSARFSVIGLHEAANANRVDAQCFAPQAVALNGVLASHGKCVPLASLLKLTAKGRQQDECVGGAVDYCSIKHISSREIVDVSRANPPIGIPLAEGDDLLLAITGATIGKVGIVKRYRQLAFSGDLLRLRSRGEVNPHYLLAALDHRLGQIQFNRWITGSTNGHLAPRDVGRVLVPRLDPKSER